MPIIKGRIKTFLNEVEYNKDFSKTAVKKYIDKMKAEQSSGSNNKNTGKGVIEKKPSRGNENNNNNNNNNINNNNYNINRPPIQYRHYSDLGYNDAPKKENYHFLEINGNNIPKSNQNLIQDPNPIPTPLKPENEKKQISDFLKNKKALNELNSPPQPSYEQNQKIQIQKTPSQKENKERITPLRNFIQKRRQETKKQGSAEEIIWFDETNKKQKEHNSRYKPSNNFPNVIFVSKQSAEIEDDKDINNNSDDNEIINEDQFDQNRWLNNLCQIANTDMEDSDNDENIPWRNQQVHEEGEEIQIDIPLPNTPTHGDHGISAINELNTTVSDYGEIEELRIILENDLGIDLFKTLYHYVDGSIDPNWFKYDYENIKERMIKELNSNEKYTEKDVANAINRIPEVFTIVLKERSLC